MKSSAALLKDFVQTAGAVAAGCYAVGLVVVNLDLGRHGVRSLDLAQPEYVMVGAMWAFLSALGVSGLVLAYRIAATVDNTKFGRSLQDPNVRPWIRLARLPVLLLFIPLFLGLASAPCGLILWFAMQLLSSVDEKGILIFTLFMNGLCVLLALVAVRMIAPTVLPPLRSDGGFNIGRAALGVLLLCFAFFVYSYGSFPMIEEKFGGGHKPLVKLLMKEALPIPWGPGIEMNRTRERIGPVDLILDKGSSLVISAHTEASWSGNVLEEAPAVEIQKDLISAIIYVVDPPTSSVFIGGGLNASGKITRSSEVYDSRTRKFSSSSRSFCVEGPVLQDGCMSDSRLGQAAAQLPGDLGGVLVTGGRDQASHAVATADVYRHPSDDSTPGFYVRDPPPGRMTEARADHTATVLAGGKVLIAGGRNGSGPLSTAELYDPNARNFRATGSMNTARYSHIAISFLARTGALAGRILIAGGSNGKEPLDTTEIYDPEGGTFTFSGNMVERRAGHTASLLKDGTIILIGGENDTGQLGTAEVFDPAAGTFSSVGAIAQKRKGHTATVLNDGRVLVAGGENEQGPLSTAEIYDPLSRKFLPCGAMTQARTGHMATLLLDGSVLISGGKDGAGHVLATVEVYDPWAETFTATASMIEARFGHSSAILP